MIRTPLVFEQIRIVEEADDLFYIPTVKNQNDGLPVRFTAETITKDEMIFQNLETRLSAIYFLFQNYAGLLDRHYIRQGKWSRTESTICDEAKEVGSH